MSGTFKGAKVVNSPARVFSVSNPATLTISGCTIDNCMSVPLYVAIQYLYYLPLAQGDEPNANSDGIAAGHNTDGFDVSSDDLVSKTLA